DGEEDRHHHGREQAERGRHQIGIADEELSDAPADERSGARAGKGERRHCRIRAPSCDDSRNCELRVAAPSPLVGEGKTIVCPKRAWVRGWLHGKRLSAERDPSSGSLRLPPSPTRGEGEEQERGRDGAAEGMFTSGFRYLSHFLLQDLGEAVEAVL